VAATEGIEVADVANTFRVGRGRLASDGFHPSDLGYQDWLRGFVPGVDRALVRDT
jgi:lysophospholipase L1-like esterase